MAQPAQAPVAIRGRAGQAVVELVIALVCILLLVSGLLQFTIMAAADTETRAEATALASDDAAGAGQSSSFQPIRDWKRGPDGYTLTRDDVAVAGSLGAIRTEIAGKTAPDGDWSALVAARSTDLREFAQAGDHSPFGFVHAHSERQIETIPAAAIFFGLRDPVIANDVWMVKVDRLY